MPNTCSASYELKIKSGISYLSNSIIPIIIIPSSIDNSRIFILSSNDFYEIDQSIPHTVNIILLLHIPHTQHSFNVSRVQMIICNYTFIEELR